MIQDLSNVIAENYDRLGIEYNRKGLHNILEKFVDKYGFEINEDVLNDKMSEMAKLILQEMKKNSFGFSMDEDEDQLLEDVLGEDPDSVVENDETISKLSESCSKEDKDCYLYSKEIENDDVSSASTDNSDVSDSIAINSKNKELDDDQVSSKNMLNSDNIPEAGSKSAIDAESNNDDKSSIHLESSQDETGEVLDQNVKSSEGDVKLSNEDVEVSEGVKGVTYEDMKLSGEDAEVSDIGVKALDEEVSDGVEKVSDDGTNPDDELHPADVSKPASETEISSSDDVRSSNDTVSLNLPRFVYFFVFYIGTAYKHKTVIERIRQRSPPQIS